MKFSLFERIATEKIDRIVILLQKTPLIRFGNGGQLREVTDHQQLHPAKRDIAMAKAAQNRVNAVQQISPHHTDFVDNQQIHTLDNVAFFLAQPMRPATLEIIIARHKRAKRELEKGVQGDTTRINGRHAGGRSDDKPLGCFFDYLTQKGGLACTGLAGKKYVAAGLFDKVFGQLQFGIWYGHVRNSLYGSAGIGDGDHR